MTKEQKQYNGAEIVFLTNGVGITAHPHEKKKNLDTDHTHITKIKSNWITAINVKHKPVTI